MAYRKDILDKKDDIIKWINEGQTLGYICTQLKCKNETLHTYLKKFGIEYKGNQGGKNAKRMPTRKSAIEYMNSTYIKSHVLKIKLIQDGLKDDKCELCGLSEWRGCKLPLELHHKDGNHFNNVLDNLQILCPNCHSIQIGNSGSNIGKYNIPE